MIDDANILDARRASLEGPYIVRTLLDDVALSDDGQHRDISITCVEFWGMRCTINVYYISNNSLKMATYT